MNNRLPPALDNGTDSRTILYGRFGLGEFSTAWVYYLGDEQLSVRQLMDSNGNITLSRTYDPFGQILQETGSGSAIYGFAGAQAGGGGLLYINGRYFDPTTGRFLSPDNNFDPLRPGTLNGYLSAAFLFAPFGVIIWRKRKGRKYNAATWFSLALIIIIGVSACQQEDNTPLSAPWQPPPKQAFPTVPSSNPVEQTQPTEQPQQPTPQPSPTPCPPSTTGAEHIYIEPETTIASNPYWTGGYREGIVQVDYRNDFSHIGTASNPIFSSETPHGTTYIHYKAPILNFAGAPIITNAQYGGRYYDQSVWNGLNEMDLYARLVSQERGTTIGSGPLDRDRVLEGIAIAHTVRNRSLDTTSPDQFSKFGTYRGQILAEGQFAFTLIHAIGGDSVVGADKWADVADNAKDKEIYEYSLRYVIGVDQGWLKDSSQGALFFTGDGSRTQFRSDYYGSKYYAYWP